jgi:hypothetical protein
MRISNVKVTFEGENKDLGCYGYRDDKTPTCKYINNCRRENGLLALKVKNIFTSKEVGGRKCCFCDEYDICFERGGKAAVARACRYWRGLEKKGATNAGK